MPKETKPNRIDECDLRDLGLDFAPGPIMAGEIRGARQRREERKLADGISSSTRWLGSEESGRKRYPRE